MAAELSAQVVDEVNDPRVRENFPERLITHLHPRSAVSEAYRTLRTSIQFGAIDRKLQAILVTSAGPGEGKSTIVANMAVTLAHAGQLVALVDADLRRPVQHKVFCLDQRKGLTSLVLGTVSLDDALQKSVVEGLWVVPSGPLPPNPSEMLGSNAFDKVLDELRHRVGYILFDAPPVMAVTDPAILAPKADGVILVLEAGNVTRQAARQARDRLDKVKAHIIGAVLNNVPVESGSMYYYHYYEQED